VAIASVLKCTAHSPGGGIANGHCSLSTSTFAAVSSSIQLNHPPSLPNSRHILEEGDDVEAFLFV
jgi:hypothetical protein